MEVMVPFLFGFGMKILITQDGSTCTNLEVVGHFPESL